MRVTIIMAKPNMNPSLKDSILRTQARGEYMERTIKAKYSMRMSECPDHTSVVDFRADIMKES